MRFLLSALVATTAFAFPALLTPGTTALANPLQLRDNTCFESASLVCVGHQAPRDSAHIAIVNACQLVPTCTQGTTPGTGNAVTGKVAGYTATLRVGKQCGGVANWSLEACVELFDTLVDSKCQAVYPSGDYQLGYTLAPCDSTLVSFNFGG